MQELDRRRGIRSSEKNLVAIVFIPSFTHNLP